MYKKAVLHAEGLILMVKLLCQFISDDPEVAGHLKKGTGVQNISIGAKPKGKGIVQGKKDGFAGFCFLEQSFLFVSVAFPADGLDVEESLVFCEQAVGDLLGGARPAVLQQVQYQEVQDDIVVSEALGLPDTEERVGIQEAAVDGKGNVGAAGDVILAHVRGEPAFQASPLVVVGPGAFFLEIISRLEAVDEEVTDIISGFWEAFDQLVEVRHGVRHSFLRFLTASGNVSAIFCILLSCR